MSEKEEEKLRQAVNRDWEQYHAFMDEKERERRVLGDKLKKSRDEYAKFLFEIKHRAVLDHWETCSGHKLKITCALISENKLVYSNLISLMEDLNGDVKRFKEKFDGTESFFSKR
jgi:hypothetical protein